jgi:tRNA(Ile)-lysidine synthase
MKPDGTTRSKTRLDRLMDDAVARYELIADGDRILIGVSGGPDSIALLHLLAARAPFFHLRIGVAHLDHGLRPESGADAEFVRGITEGLGVEFFTKRIDLSARQRRPHVSLESAAREARYDFLRTTAERFGFNKVALGHHADDNAETVLLHLLRGSGRLGLGGIRAIREGVYLRPLIRATRGDIERYLTIRRLRFRIDSTNTDPAMLRNRIRHKLLPLLERDYRQGVSAVLSRSAEMLADEEAWLDGLLKPVLEQIIADRAPGRLTIAAAELRGLPLAAQRRLVRMAVQRVQGVARGLAFEHVEQILRIARRSGAAGPLNLPGHLCAQIRQGALEFQLGQAGLRPNVPPVQPFEHILQGCGSLTIPETGDRLVLSEAAQPQASDPRAAGSNIAFLNGDIVRFPLTIRSWRPGDRFRPLGAGGTQKLKKFFSDHKIPGPVRRRCPLLVSGDRIFWVAGHRIDQQARVGLHTGCVLKAEIIFGDGKAIAS